MKKVLHLLLCVISFFILTPSFISYASSNEWSFGYTGGIQEFTAPKNGTYRVEVWGAQGGSSAVAGGKGGYTSVEIVLSKDQIIYIAVGGAGVTKGTGGYNGGGNSTVGASGGGATHVALTNRGLLSNYENYKDEIIAVAGGGGGSYYTEKLVKNAYFPGNSLLGSFYRDVYVFTLPGEGGGGAGGNSSLVNLDKINGVSYNTTGGTATSGYSFGKGQNGASGGGGGWYGGYTRTSSSDSFCSGSGGSGYFKESNIGVPKTFGNINTGHSKCKISYNGTYERTVTLDTKNIGTCNGETGLIVLTYNAGETVTLSNIQTYSGYTFEYWINSKTKEKVNNTFTINDENIDLEPMFKASLQVEKYKYSPSSIKIAMRQDDPYTKYFKVLQSKDGTNWYDAFLASDTLNATPMRNTSLSPGNYEYTHQKLVLYIHSCQVIMKYFSLA